MRYSIVQDASRVDISAKSSLHPINGSSRNLRGYVSIAWNDGALALEPAPEMHVELPVESLTSGNALEDDQMRKIAGSRSFPNIIADLSELRPLDRPSRYAVKGQIQVRGTSRAIDGEIEITNDDGRIVLDGARTIDVRDFGITPPSFLMFKVDPEVTIRLHVVAQAENS